MAEAKITLSLTPREFDVAREELDKAYRGHLGVAEDRHTDYAIKQASRKRAVELGDLLVKLR